MEMATDYDWLFPRGRFSRQARILETQLLYSGGLSEKSQTSAAFLQRELSTSTLSPQLKSIRSRSTALPMRDLVQMPPEGLHSPDQARLFPRPEDGLLVSKLQRELQRKEREAFEVSQGLQKETLEAVRLRGHNQELGHQLEQTLSQIGQLEAQLGLQEKQLASKEKTLDQLNQFLQDTSEKQARARESLKDHMEELIQRAESAENEISTLRSSAAGPVSLAPSRLLPESSSSTLHSEESGGYSRSGLHQGQNYSRGHSGQHDGTLPYADPNWLATNGTGQPDRGWLSSRPRSTQTCPARVQPLMQNPMPRQYPESYLSPSLSRSDFDGYHPGPRHPSESGLGSTGTRRQQSADRNGEPTAPFHHPGVQMTSSRAPQEQTRRNPYPSQDQCHNSSQNLLHSLHSLGIQDRGEFTDGGIEPTIRPSLNSDLLQAYPTQHSSGSQRPPVYNNRDWDLNFLTEVMEDVLKNRDVEKHLADKPSGAGYRQQRSQSNVAPAIGQSPSPVQADRPTPSPRRGDTSPSPVAHHWSSSDDDEDITDSESPDESEPEDLQIDQMEVSNSEGLSAQDPPWRSAWLSVFTHLDTATLLTCAQVCREWRAISKHPSLWATVRLTNSKISSTFLQTIGKWCEALEHLHLEGLRPRSRRQGENQEKYAKNTWGSLEPGLEYVLISAGARLITLKIVDCSNILTERSLFLASCYCRNLYSLTYVSQTNPIGHEVIWALGAGCRNIASLKVPPRQPCQYRQRLSNRCLQMIGRCWPLLLALSVGGQSIDINGLVSVANNCPRLQVLELDHLTEVTEVIAIAMCQAGLRGLHTLILRGTLITPAAVIHFNGACPQLKSLSIYLSPGICRGDNKDFHNVVSQLRALTKRRVLADVLHVYAKYN